MQHLIVLPDSIQKRKFCFPNAPGFVEFQVLPESIVGAKDCPWRAQRPVLVVEIGYVAGNRHQIFYALGFLVQAIHRREYQRKNMDVLRMKSSFHAALWNS